MPPQERSYRWLHAIELAHTLIYHLPLQNPCGFFCLSLQCSSLVKIRLQRSTKARTALVMILHVISSFKKSQIPQSLHQITHCWPSSPVSRTSEVQWVSTGQSPGKGTVQGSSAKTVASLSFCLGPQVTTQTEVSSMCLEATSRLWRVFFKDEALQLNTFRGSISTGSAPPGELGQSHEVLAASALQRFTYHYAFSNIYSNFKRISVFKSRLFILQQLNIMYPTVSTQ